MGCFTDEMTNLVTNLQDAHRQRREAMDALRESDAQRLSEARQWRGHLQAFMRSMKAGVAELREQVSRFRGAQRSAMNAVRADLEAGRNAWFGGSCRPAAEHRGDARSTKSRRR